MIDINNFKIQCLDTGGCGLWPLQVYYIDNIEAYVLVVDSSDMDRIDETKKQFEYVIYNDKFPKNIPILIFANKNDRVLKFS